MKHNELYKKLCKQNLKNPVFTQDSVTQEIARIILQDIETIEQKLNITQEERLKTPQELLKPIS
jgi:hypothetical protein